MLNLARAGRVSKCYNLITDIAIDTECCGGSDDQIHPCNQTRWQCGALYPGADSKRDLPCRSRRGGRDRSTSEALAAEVVSQLEQTTPEGEMPNIEQIQDMVEKVLIENGRAKVAKAYILYREERARQREKRTDRDRMPSGNIPWPKLWQTLDWACSHNVHTTALLNEAIRNDRLHEIVTAAEAAYHEDVENAANMILDRRDEVRMVFVAGPSSSGKTTTTIKIGDHLAELGFKLITLNIDHYFHDLDMHPKDEFGDYDFETPQALNMKLINQNLTDLFEGREVRIPYYDFRTGRSIPDHTPMKLGKQEIILIDSLHGLYPEMTEDVPNEWKFKLYIEPLLQLKDSQGHYARWTDVRLMRRMLRDASHRAYDPTRHYYIGTMCAQVNCGTSSHTSTPLIRSSTVPCPMNSRFIRQSWARLLPVGRKNIKMTLCAGMRGNVPKG